MANFSGTITVHSRPTGFEAIIEPERSLQQPTLRVVGYSTKELATQIANDLDLKIDDREPRNGFKLDRRTDVDCVRFKINPATNGYSIRVDVRTKRMGAMLNLGMFVANCDEDLMACFLAQLSAVFSLEPGL